MDDEVKVFSGEADRIEFIRDGDPGFVLHGMKEVSGTFEGNLLDGAWATMMPGPMEVYLYAPDTSLPWWRHWFYRIREAVRGTPYPTRVLAHGPATFAITSEEDDGDDVVVKGTFTRAGTWTFDDDPVAPATDATEGAT